MFVFGILHISSWRIWIVEVLGKGLKRMISISGVTRPVEMPPSTLGATEGIYFPTCTATHPQGSLLANQTIRSLPRPRELQHGKGSDWVDLLPLSSTLASVHTLCVQNEQDTPWNGLRNEQKHWASNRPLIFQKNKKTKYVSQTIGCIWGVWTYLCWVNIYLIGHRMPIRMQTKWYKGTWNKTLGWTTHPIYVNRFVIRVLKSHYQTCKSTWLKLGRPFELAQRLPVNLANGLTIGNIRSVEEQTEVYIRVYIDVSVWFWAIWSYYTTYGSIDIPSLFCIKPYKTYIYI